MYWVISTVMNCGMGLQCLPIATELIGRGCVAAAHRYLLDKMVTNFGPERSNPSGAGPAVDMAAEKAHARFLDNMDDGEMPRREDFDLKKLISSGA
jgi:hypothetical protein